MWRLIRNSNRFYCNSNRPSKLWEAVIGIEVHAQLHVDHKLLSHTGLFSAISSAPLTFDQYHRFESSPDQTLLLSTAPPNTLLGFADTAVPGALPSVNWDSVYQLCRTGTALGGNIQKFSRFDRKHYFYPDLPTAYQITQQFYPLILGGHVDIYNEDYDIFTREFEAQLLEGVPQTKQVGKKKLQRIQEQQERESKKREKLGNAEIVDLVIPEAPPVGSPKRIGITRIHLEHDSGKSFHDQDPDHSLIDFNRAGVALMEIVSEADIRSPLEAAIYVSKLQTVLQHVGSSRALMEDGSIRCDVNISVRPYGSPKFGVRSEIKNLNSLKNVKQSCEAEIRRQILALSNGITLSQETRGFNVDRQTTFTLRRKETEVDYRYFPEPDLPALILSDEFVAKCQNSIPALPDELRNTYTNSLNIPLDVAMTIINTPGATAYFEHVRANRNAVQVANWLVSELFGLLAADGKSLAQCPVNEEQFGSLMDVLDRQISGKIGKQVLREMYDGNPKLAQQIVEERGWNIVEDDSEIRALCQSVIDNNPVQVEDYLSSSEDKRTRKLKFFMGEVMKISKGKVPPATASQLITELLQNK